MTIFHAFLGNDSKLQWANIKEYSYDDREFAGIKKYVLIGPDDSAKFEFRIFQFEVESKSDLARHDKEYAFYILEGSARIQVENIFYDLNPKDCFYISKNQIFQIVNVGENILRFVCIVSNR